MKNRRLSVAILLGLAGWSAASAINRGFAQDAAEPSADERAEHLARMKALAQSVKILAEPGRDDSAVKLADEPLLRYADNTRYNNEATLWLWTSGGRPAAIAAFELYPRHPEGPQWLYEIASLSADRIAANRGEKLAWEAKAPGLKFETVAAADPPADKPVRRLGQMKAILRRFSAHESTATEGRIELRLLPNPLHRYSDETLGIIDGALFAFASGTNPEVFLVLEASGLEGKPAAWRYTLAQMTGAVVTVQLDEKEIWTRGEADPPAVRESYVNGWLSQDEARKTASP